jgi:lon-related putative ATP-dependent protease
MAGRGKRSTPQKATKTTAKRNIKVMKKHEQRKPRELAPGDFCPCCDPKIFPFETTARVSSNDEIVGQGRAVKSLEFGLGIDNRGFNIYAAGISGTGKSSIINRLVRKMAEGESVPDDWVYVYNFREPDRPNAIHLPSGKGRALQKMMEKLIEDLKEQIPRVFESKSYEEQKSQFLGGFQEKRAELLMKLDREAEGLGLSIKSTPAGLITLPLLDGKSMEPSEYEALPAEEKEKIHKNQEIVNQKIRDTLREIKEIEKKTREQVEKLNREVAAFVIGPFIDELVECFKDVPEVPEYLRDVKADILENVGEFLKDGTEKEAGMPGMAGMTLFNRYRINLLVDNSQAKGAPVIYETNPTYTNLVGYVDRKVLLGALYTDFSLIRAGALLRANGGYLIANALDVLRSPFSYDALKRSMRNSEVRIEDISDQLGFHTAGGMHPEPIPLQVKVVLIGNPMVYYLLHSLDEEFRKIFKVKADFSQMMDRSMDHTLQLGSFIGRICREEGLLHLTREAVAAIVDHSSRLVEDRDKLTLRLGDIADLLREASFWAKKDRKKLVSAAHVEKAVGEKLYRSRMVEERVQELITEGTFMIDVEGKVVGQINGLAVYDLGDFTFGRPTRITAQVFSGRAGIVNIERRARLSGRTHDKGVMILSGYFGGKYGKKMPLNLSVSITFEQSYEEIEGDSASSTELYAVMSGIGDFPIDQGIAVTGSVNQRGEIQPVGAINRKIEGFFDICRTKGLTGTQGVIIPQQNVKHLMVRKDVIDAVKKGEFHVYPVKTVDEGIEILTGMKAGKMGKDGNYPADSVHGIIFSKLARMIPGKDQEKGPGRARNSKRKTKTARKK